VISRFPISRFPIPPVLRFALIDSPPFCTSVHLVASNFLVYSIRPPNWNSLCSKSLCHAVQSITVPFPIKSFMVVGSAEQTYASAHPTYKDDLSLGPTFPSNPKRLAPCYPFGIFLRQRDSAFWDSDLFGGQMRTSCISWRSSWRSSP
jgi:hypothetical protein